MEDVAKPSEANAPWEESRAGHVGATALTEANLIKHNNCIGLSLGYYASVEHWLSSSEVFVVRNRIAKDWQVLVRRDKVAAEIEDIIQDDAQAHI